MIHIHKKLLAEAMKGFRTLKIQNNTLEIIRTVHVRTCGPTLSLEVTNLDESLEYCCERMEGETGYLNCLVPYEVLREAERHADKTESIGIDHDRIYYVAGGVAMEHPYEAGAVEDFPPSVQFENKNEVLDVESVQALREAAGYASTDSTRYIMNGVHVSPNYVAATDGRRLYVCNNRNLKVPEEGIIIPVRASLKLFDPGCDVHFKWPLSVGRQLNRTKIALSQGRWRLVLKLIEGNFPDWQPLLKSVGQGNSTELIIDEEDATTLLKSLPALAGAHIADSPVSLTMAGQFAQLVGHDGTNRQSVELKRSQWKGASSSIRFNRNFLQQALNMGLRHVFVKGALDGILMQDRRYMRKVLWMPLRGGEPIQKASPENTEGAAIPEEAKTNPVMKTEYPVSESTTIKAEVEEAVEVDSETETFTADTCPRSVAPLGYHRNPCQSAGSQSDASDEAESPEAEDPWSMGMEACGQLREQLRTALAALSSLQGHLRKTRQDHLALKRDSRALRKGIRELQKLEV